MSPQHAQTQRQVHCAEAGVIQSGIRQAEFRTGPSRPWKDEFAAISETLAVALRMSLLLGRSVQVTASSLSRDPAESWGDNEMLSFSRDRGQAGYSVELGGQPRALEPPPLISRFTR